MIDKFVRSTAEALAGVRSGATILIGGFGQVGTPNALIEALSEADLRDLTVVCNNAGTGTHGLARVMAEGRVAKIICSYPRSAGSVVLEELYREGRIALEIVPQGTIAERLRAASAGLAAFYTPTGVGTALAEGKETREFDGRTYVLEHALKGDVALIEAWCADRWGNLTYRRAGRNFNPVMAMAADLTIAQTQTVVELGALDPEAIVTPGVFVDRVVHIPYGEPDLGKPLY
ncbi:3-oxoacid CoA-transferase subunit A [Elioraea sp.]|uniref:3-oxoacid CoA-transferase subunit A n=1 Tax=Elioraea sp. TaxID=2185103 RepID=UPI0025BFFA92|nr:3-oxoacid CoA-transferase subunit A [Elioraea sp.]